MFGKQNEQGMVSNPGMTELCQTLSEVIHDDHHLGWEPEAQWVGCGAGPDRLPLTSDVLTVSSGQAAVVASLLEWLLLGISFSLDNNLCSGV